MATLRQRARVTLLAGSSSHRPVSYTHLLAGKVLDYATRDMLQEILWQEDRHLDELEELQDQIEQMTLPTFLSTQNGR